MTITGVIQSIAQRETKAGISYRIKINGTEYSSFEPIQAATGDTVTFDAVQNGQWWNVKSPVKKTDAAAAPPPFAGVPYQAPSTSGNGADDQGKRITRSMALKAAMDWMNQTTGAESLEDGEWWREYIIRAHKIYRVAWDEKQWDLQVELLTHPSE